MLAVRLSTRWAGVAALVVASLSACHRAAPVPGPAPRVPYVVIDSAAGEVESPALAEAERVAARIVRDRERAARLQTGVARNPHDAITADQWRDQHVTRVEELIAGRVAGVALLRTATGLSLRIRGPNSIFGETEPLIVIDGQTLPQGGGQLSLINPEDVARIEVLKDAGATGYYGVRGANGVILVTTKHGR